MPSFSFTSPEGKSYTVQGPDGSTPAEAFQILQTQLGGSAPQPSVGEDIAKGAGSGLVNGITSTLGMGGDAGSLLGAGVDYAGSKLGIEPDRVQQFKDIVKAGTRFTPPGSVLQGPSSQDLKSILENTTGDLSYQPKTFAGGAAQKAAEFLPALIGGPETPVIKALTRVAAPALASEAAGKLTEGTAARPYAELAGALTGAGGASVAAQKFKAAMAARQAAGAVPSAENLLSAAGKQFDAVKASDLVIHPDAVKGMAKDMRTELLNDGFHPDTGNQKGVFSTIDRLEALGQQPGGVTPKDMEVIRKNLVGAKTDMDPGAARAARDATGSFMSKYADLGSDPANILNGDANQTFGTLKDAIGNYAAGKRSNIVTGKADLANLNAATAGSGANIDNNTRQAIKQLARPMNNTNVPVAKKLGFNDPEIAAINTAARGTAIGNTARYLGKAAPTGIVSALMSGGAGAAAGGLPGAVALPAAGYIAKKIGDLSTARAVSALDSLVRSRSPLAAHVAAQLPAQLVQQLPAKTTRLLRTMVLANSTLAQASQPVGQQNTN